MPYPPTPPLLLTRRLAAFLHASLAALQEQQQLQLQQQPHLPQPPALQTALLITPSGKLLAYESPVPVRTLRTQCSVAASLWAIHAASAPAVAVALGHSPALPDGAPDAPDSAAHAPVSIAVSFQGGAVFVVRRLRCGLLFACATPPPGAGASRPSTATPPPVAVPELAVQPPDAAAPPPPSLSPPRANVLPIRLPSATVAAPTSASDDGRPSSATTTGTTTTITGGAGSRPGAPGSVALTVAIARRQVEELARLLDEKLGVLTVPEENIGVNGFR